MTDSTLPGGKSPPSPPTATSASASTVRRGHGDAAIAARLGTGPEEVSER
jgi:hypothetical protein